ncbi:MAG: general secretion pathway protein J [Candidatus Azotimanducaceae bacterium]|jgi:general secretion pathway protein J
MGRQKRHQYLGFTLIEMVIAVAIFAVMMVIAFPGLTHIAKVGDQVGQSNRRLSELQFALTYLSRDWMQVSSRKILDQYGDEKPHIIIKDNSISFTHSGWSNLLQQKRSELQRVQYLVKENQLIRQYWTSLDQMIAEEPIATVLIDDIESFSVHFIDSSEQAIERWPLGEQDEQRVNKPIALRVDIDVKNFGQVHRIIEIPDGVL